MSPAAQPRVKRPTREELRDMVQKLKDAANATPALDFCDNWTKLVIEAEAMLRRCRTGAYFKKTEVCHRRIRELAPVFYERMQRGDRVLTIARECGCNRTTVRKWAKIERDRRKKLESRQS